ncbi:FliM/FliN family flagellar motor switch protein [Pseudoalteromonas sp. APC 3224]|uniref:FliM/FliN family flagellar motor switch protein n=1 Tax=Pseudoalteromonas sp. APC 3224 TaxID=3035203 RepID=UPI0025B39572|nr:FliM/FliN family flagellar motor switch protein [Pseudoalteromonas sp. APC 3224]MDN3484784.1 FliM/FliN family flagellar motor switch protein [Pseudoalteromonas sp. APC 3224]
MSKTLNAKTKLIKAKNSEHITPFALTLEQRAYEQAQQKAAHINVNIRKTLELELAQLFNDSRFDVEISPCSHSVINSWFKESPRIFLACPLFTPTQGEAYLALDYQSAYKTADLCLGGQFNNVNSTEQVSDEVNNELSSTESRICGRLLQRQVQGIQGLLFRERSALLGEIQKSHTLPEALQYLAFKVRFILENQVISWFLWLPISFFCAADSEQDSANSNTLNTDMWAQFAVQGQIEMAKKKVTLKQLKACVAGGVLPIELNEAALFNLGHKQIFKGQVVEQETGLAFQITQLSNNTTSN